MRLKDGSFDEMLRECSLTRRPLTHLAEETGIPYSRLYYRLRKIGLRATGHSKNGLPPSAVDLPAARLMRERGMTYRQIAAFFGVSRQRVHQMLSDAKESPRR